MTGYELWERLGCPEVSEAEEIEMATDIECPKCGGCYENCPHCGGTGLLMEPDGSKNRPKHTTEREA